MNRGVLAIAATGALALIAYVWSAHGAQPAVLLLIGVGLGIALFHSRFGFTSAWRQLMAVGNGTGLRAHALLLGTTATMFALIIGTGTGFFGNQPGPAAGVLGIGLVAGAFLFGLCNERVRLVGFESSSDCSAHSRRGGRSGNSRSGRTCWPAPRSPTRPA